jgi:hypothetical protein
MEITLSLGFIEFIDVQMGLFHKMIMDYNIMGLTKNTL